MVGHICLQSSIVSQNSFYWGLWRTLKMTRKQSKFRTDAVKILPQFGKAFYGKSCHAMRALSRWKGHLEDRPLRLILNKYLMRCNQLLRSWGIFTRLFNERILKGLKILPSSSAKKEFFRELLRLISTWWSASTQFIAPSLCEILNLTLSAFILAIFIKKSDRDFACKAFERPLNDRPAWHFHFSSNTGELGDWDSSHGRQERRWSGLNQPHQGARLSEPQVTMPKMGRV